MRFVLGVLIEDFDLFVDENIHRIAVEGETVQEEADETGGAG
jgi:hypothetical protein